VGWQWCWFSIRRENSDWINWKWFFCRSRLTLLRTSSENSLWNSSQVFTSWDNTSISMSWSFFSKIQERSMIKNKIWNQLQIDPNLKSSIAIFTDCLLQPSFTKNSTSKSKLTATETIIQLLEVIIKRRIKSFWGTIIFVSYHEMKFQLQQH
jgi:hypothetical protein